MAKKKPKYSEAYSDKEAKRRFEAALLGSRLVSAKPKKNLGNVAKRSKARKKPG